MGKGSVDTDDLIAAFTLPFTRGLLFVDDTATTARHAGWNPVTDWVHADNDSLWICVRGAADGPATVELYRAPPSASTLKGLAHLHSGALDTPTRELRVTDSDGAIVVTHPVYADRVHVDVHTDPDTGGERVVIGIRPVG
ncbi:hypothetical protein V5P93_003189 [Actinokineospora auranticolor]|uniref:Uncharacterized protein n=1 Tax=Actinokineospora auranticolor TaxID=155976 RepID=A0A2S6H1I0_9PSEU|nr:hypothetical protein [Actinokineospora auranticolor]PPK71323.1 hypothetical protein CLV40_101512 [Actinokineospora auranticolor]